MRKVAGNPEALHPELRGDPSGDEQSEQNKSGTPRIIRRAIGHWLVRLQRQISAAMHDKHRATHKTAKQGEGIEKAQKISLVGHAQGVVEAEWHAPQGITDGNSKNQSRNRAADE